MELKAFMNMYENFLQELKESWHVEVKEKRFGYQLTSITNDENIEVQFFFEINLDQVAKISETTNQSVLKYGVIRQKGTGDIFAKEVLDRFHCHLAEHKPKHRTKLIYYIP
ncbi:hypothetical protein R4Z10_11680 [Niallia sp. XMNu-256]|uniref:hypothetical protein n=1 Tax=Niallia sp. XMNu-256 TaxID=3082444 RepID=UPI0030CAA754